MENKLCFYKNWIILFAYMLPIITMNIIILLIIIIFAVDSSDFTPIYIIIPSITLAFLIFLCFTKLVLTKITISDDGFELTYFKKTLFQFGWNNVIDVQFEIGAYHIYLKTNKREKPVMIMYDVKKAMYIIDKCPYINLKNKIIEESPYIVRSKYGFKRN